MNIVSKQDLKYQNLVEHGTFSDIYSVLQSGSEFYYKEFREEYPLDIIKNIAMFTDENYSEEFLTPRYMVRDSETNAFSGYLTNPKKSLYQISEIKNLEEQKILLMQAKSSILKLRYYYGIIHGDLNKKNILIDELNVANILDFDTALRFGQPVGSDSLFPSIIKDYLKYNPFDERIDTYGFNLTTLATILNCDWKEVLSKIYNDDYSIPGETIMCRKLAKELLLTDSKKKYSGEFIIDYI